MPRIFLLITVATMMLSACKARQSESRMKDLNKPEGLAIERFDDPTERAKIPVLIYYLNESFYYKTRAGKESIQHRENWQYLHNAMAACPSLGFSSAEMESLKNFTERLFNDHKEFIDAGYWEYGIVHSLMSKNPRLKNFVFKNADTYRVGQENFKAQGQLQRWASFPSLPAGSPEVYEYQPLMRPEVLESAIEEVKRLAPPDKHRYILITKSHGNRTMALTAFLARDIRALSQKQICEALLAHQKSIQNNVLGKDTADPLGKDTADPLGKDTADPLGKDTADPLGKDGSGPLGAPSAMEFLAQLATGKNGLDAPSSGVTLPGISKNEFSDLLIRHNDMYFPIVVMEACKSEFSFADRFKSVNTKKFVPNISFVYTSDSGGLNYKNFDYQILFRETNQGKDLQDVMKRILDLAVKK